jgi:hypothetical protein
MLTPDAAIPANGAPGGIEPVKGEVSAWIVVSMVIGLAALLILGVHLPSQLSHLLDRAASELGNPR